jgi:hypothetical protein
LITPIRGSAAAVMPRPSPSGLSLTAGTNSFQHQKFASLSSKTVALSKAYEPDRTCPAAEFLASGRGLAAENPPPPSRRH